MTENHALPVINDLQLTLHKLASSVVERCPDMWEMARLAAVQILHTYGQGAHAPDQVYWHRFDNGQSNPRSFTGWEHVGPPLESVSLTQLVMRRFTPHDQDNADLLVDWGGFYTADARTHLFNESNEVPLLPQDVLHDFWKLDFATQFNTRLNEFWTQDKDAYRALTKINFLARAFEDLDNGTLHPRHFTSVMKAAAGSFSTPASLAKIHQRDQAPAGLSIRALDIGGYQATDILRIVDEHGRQIIYMPDEDGSFHVFESVADLHWWLLVQTNDPGKLPIFMSHFALSAYAADGTDVGLHDVLITLFMSHARGDHSCINQNDLAIAGDPFDWLSDQARERMHKEAKTALHSNSQLRKKLWIGYLSTTANLTGALGMLCWPVALAAVGADLASLGLNIDQAVNGRNTAERKAGVMGAIFSSIDALLNTLVVVGAAGELKALGEDSRLAEAKAVPPLPLEPLPLPKHLAVELEHNPLNDFVANVLLSDEELANKGTLAGVYNPGDGHFYIQLDELPYQVRYIGELKTWVVVDPGEPFSFFRHYPVELQADGSWALRERPGLRGGTGRLFGRRPWGSARTAAAPQPAAASPYDIPEQYRAKLAETAARSQYYREGFIKVNDEEFNQATIKFEQLRKDLLDDAGTFFDLYKQAPRPTIPTLEANTPAKGIIKSIYAQTDGLVIGETHDSIASKQFLIDNMTTLSKQKVKTLYFEHLMTDMHASGLEAFNRTGVMDETLLRYVQNLDAGHGTDALGNFTFEAVLKSANEHHIQVRAIDCLSSYVQNDLPRPVANARQKMMNFYASKTITADQQLNGPHRWVALVGNSHSNTFEGVPGVSEMNHAIGLRIADVPLGTATSIGEDAGDSFKTSGIGNATAFVKGDLLLSIATKPAVIAADISSRLPQAGMFLVDATADPHLLVHRSRSGELIRTPIEHAFAGVKVTRNGWPSISGRWYRNEEKLLEAIRVVLGMRQVR
ncbi:membrane-targeted effector domain-containing toxin [Pseudomonas rubra]|uniref:Membrane-targeted effector domain-containing toxin n=1 Tax=Pseudomonas rubra TaxID=2942627 RepID=A0ABT5P7G8_9PSED|nr:membrane-targeted effector domain-containing toxin [Pseudomonas rubra]MDD1014231.1 membrane-targeted effector domain-containing toxin [Pseudomonas rubra]MDD1037654.1 membrane-targeted effector domain-containing toxin [Pseudomonas rubra]MDD1155750.1 membrane-targeted effector domain-containing toxin [Pseudomonas rubra]